MRFLRYPAGMATPTASGSYAFEVYCNSCRVSLPAGTRRCLHCGGPTSAQRGSEAMRVSAGEASALPQLPPLDEIDDAVPMPGRPRRGGISFSSLVWLLFLVAYSVYRTCSR